MSTNQAKITINHLNVLLRDKKEEVAKIEQALENVEQATNGKTSKSTRRPSKKRTSSNQKGVRTPRTVAGTPPRFEVSPPPTGSAS
ncbi:MAG: hypothetical protein U5R31_07510 [Acidimicrobiia bacterium]|nr:hypothetical protein [Acidimicrobiia bacterium]